MKTKESLVAEERLFRVYWQALRVYDGYVHCKETDLGIFTESEAREILLSGPSSEPPVAERWVYRFTAETLPKPGCVAGAIQLYHWSPGEIQEVDVANDPVLQGEAAYERSCVAPKKSCIEKR